MDSNTNNTSLSTNDAISIIDSSNHDESSMMLTTLFKCEHAECRTVATSALAAHAYNGEGSNILVRGDTLCPRCQKESANLWDKLQHSEIMLNRCYAEPRNAFWFAATWREIRDVHVLDQDRGLLKDDIDRVCTLWANVVLYKFQGEGLRELYSQMYAMLPQSALDHAQQAIQLVSQKMNIGAQSAFGFGYQSSEGIQNVLTPSGLNQPSEMGQPLEWSNQQNMFFGNCIMGCQTAEECCHGNFQGQEGMGSMKQQNFSLTPLLANVGMTPAQTPLGFDNDPFASQTLPQWPHSDISVAGCGQNSGPWNSTPAPAASVQPSSFEQSPSAFFVGSQGAADSGSSNVPWDSWAPTPGEYPASTYDMYAATGQNAFVEGYQDPPMNAEVDMGSATDEPRGSAMAYDHVVIKEEDPDHTYAIVLAGGDDEYSEGEAPGLESEVDESTPGTQGESTPQTQDGGCEAFLDPESWDESGNYNGGLFI